MTQYAFVELFSFTVDSECFGQWSDVYYRGLVWSMGFRLLAGQCQAPIVEAKRVLGLELTVLLR